MGLEQEQHPCWIVACDRCGEGDNSEYGGSFHYPSKAEAERELRNMDWGQAQDGSWLCLDCYEEARTEQYSCPDGGGCHGRCGHECPVPFAAQHPGPRRAVDEATA